MAAYLQLRREGDFPLKKELPWLAAFGFVGGAAGWVDMFMVSGSIAGFANIINILRVVLHFLTGLLILRFGWGIFAKLNPLPPWSVFVPGVLIIPIAFVFTYAATTFITPSPIEIPIEIWTRYLLYLPGSLLAGVGFLRQWYIQRKLGLFDVSNLMLGAGMAFLFEAVVVGLIVPAAPFGPASYYNYDRIQYNAFLGENFTQAQPYPMILWLDYKSVLSATGLPIEIWRMFSAIIVMIFVVKALDVFEAIRRRQILALQEERDRAQQDAISSQVSARRSAEKWSYALVNISRRIAELSNVDDILMFIVQNVRQLFNADFVGLAILNQENSSLELKTYSTATDSSLVVNNSIAVTNPQILEVCSNSRTFRYVGNGLSDVFKNESFSNTQNPNALAAVPIKLDNLSIGALWISRIEQNPFNETDLIWLESMSDQVAITIQHGLMTSQLQSLSIIEERGRIAREMHDGLAQVLGYLNLQVQTLGSLLQQGKSDRLQAELAQMRQAIQIANADVRENILSLRTTLANEKGLASAMQEYLDEFGIQTGIETKFTYDVEGDLNLSSIAEVQLVCILQEALTNVRKHSRSENVQVWVQKVSHADNENISMRIRDNGIGFTVASSKLSFGLQTMRERAESVAGSLTIKSANGFGTTIECRLPCLKQERLKNQSVVIP